MDTPDPADAPGPRRDTVLSWGTYALLGLLVVFAAGALGYGMATADHIRHRAQPRLQAATAARLAAADAHLWAEELVGGDPLATPERVWGSLDTAADNLNALLSGGRLGTEPVAALTDPEQRELARQARELLEDARGRIGDRLAAFESGAPATQLDEVHDGVLEDLLAHTARLEDRLGRYLGADLEAFRRTEGVLLGTGLALGALALVLALGLERRRRAARRALSRESDSRRAAEAETALLATAISQAAEIIFITDPEARIRYVNRAFVERLGWKPDDVVGRHAEVLRSQHHEGAFYDAMDAGLAKGRTWTGTLHLARADGDSVEVEQTITPIKDASGRVTDYVVVARDVTQERTLQAQMEHVQRLESLGVLAGGIAHDFNNILTSIMGNAALARLGCAPEAEMVEHLAHIETASARASELCAQMLAYAGKGRMELKATSLTDVVEEMPRLLQVSIGRGVSLRFDLKPALPAVQADAARIRQVLMNLVINASEAIGPHPGEITVRTGTAHVGRRELAKARIGADLKAGDYVFLEVVDTGCGMDAATRKRIFEPFFTTKFTGRGLGMSAVLGIVRSHHGALLLDSKPGRGTTFRLLLPPSTEGMPIPPAPPEAETGCRGSGRMLVVDDEPGVRQVTCGMLERMGFATETAPDGESAAARFRADPGRYDGVMLDLTMPGHGGEATFHALRRARPDVPVLLFSGYSDHVTVQRLADVGRTAFLAKPFNSDQLQAKLRMLLEGTEEPVEAPEEAPSGPGPAQ
jgi:PAS domain S-box-containing protein